MSKKETKSGFGKHLPEHERVQRALAFIKKHRDLLKGMTLDEVIREFRKNPTDYIRGRAALSAADDDAIRHAYESAILTPALLGEENNSKNVW